MNFGDRICAEVDKKASRIVVGLDPRLDLVPPRLLGAHDTRNPARVADALLAFNQLIIESIADLAVAVKPQLAFYEAYGSFGIRALERTNRHAHQAGLLVICDAKRSDIGSTAEAYAQAFLTRQAEDGWGIYSDAVTVNPYFGSDGLRPFVDAAAANGKGVFILVKTSNPSSVELQDAPVQGEPLYGVVARLLRDLSQGTVGDRGYSHVGAVVGATFPQAGQRLRELLPESIFLVPGLGAQGARADQIGTYFDRNGQGALISASRSITSAGARGTTLKEVAALIRGEAAQMRDDINSVIYSRRR